MQICSIITEYNPFHMGHRYQIEEIRRRLPDCAVVSLMSGNYVQRGEPALWDKYTRARSAVCSGGPDLVLELPLTAALSSAEGFARGGVQLIQALGCVTHLSFGCETGTEETLLTLASILNSSKFHAQLRDAMQSGKSYAQAAEFAANRLCPACCSLLRSPNDILAVQYCRMLLQYGSEIQPLAVRRIGAKHDGSPQDGIPSASFIRKKILSEESDGFSLIPSAYRQQIRDIPVHSWTAMEIPVLSYLRRLTPEDICTLPNVSEGLENRFYAACQTSSSLEQLWQQTQSRRHPLSRVRRLTLCAYLGITQELAAHTPAFVTVLAMNMRGREILKQMKTTCRLPVIVKPVQARALHGSASQLWHVTVSADDQYYFPAPAGRDWTSTPFCM